jgi:hypothetical protein
MKRLIDFAKLLVLCLCALIALFFLPFADLEDS